MTTRAVVCVSTPEGPRYFACKNQDGTPHEYSGYSRIAAFRFAYGREPTQQELTETTTLFDPIEIVIEEDCKLATHYGKYKIGDPVFNGYVGVVTEVGPIPNIELNDMVGWAGKPGYGIRFYEIDPDTNLRTDELCKICWFPVEKVDSWDPLPPAVPDAG